MPGLARQIYVISDLHLGGTYLDPARPRESGFRICTEVPALTSFVDSLARKPGRNPAIELVINGDLVDFLAEREPSPPFWLPFTHDPEAATRKLEAIAERDQGFFAALRAFLERGHRLVLLLGNHDIELALPPVRRALASLIGADRGRDFEFLYDGEAYLVGDALIEHGNRYDRFNIVDFDRLRRFRSLLSRRQDVGGRNVFNPPAGSKMVATVINPIKEDYRFVDLLKPETGAVIPLLLALEPGFRSLIAQAAKFALESLQHKLQETTLPGSQGDIAADVSVPDHPAAARGFTGPLGSERALRDIMGSLMGEESGAFLEEVDDLSAESGRQGNISALDEIDRTLGLMRLVFARARDHVQRRCPLLLKALRCLTKDQSFREDVETAPEYIDAARDLAGDGIRHVVFGHTHLAKRVALDGKGFYLNSGTWANVMEFPADILHGPETEAIPRVHDFVRRLAEGDFSGWTLCRPNYVRLDLGTDGRVTSQLCRYAGPESV